MSDLVEFYRARLDDEDRCATAAIHAGLGVDIGPDGKVIADNPHVHDHFATWHPARVLREVEAKRRLLDLHPHVRFAATPDEWPEHWRAETRQAFPGTDQPYVGCKNCDWDYRYEAVQPNWWCETLRLLALPYDTHPDYDERWKP